ncbi:MAG TPA: DNA-directed DNA polymerase II small subunit [Natrialbaceae archaeon]|nr:DNA-directed DNA polymerase II small subunit [Natrialbaceae archaeon]
MPLEGPARIVSELTSRGYNAEREAVTLLAGADDPAVALERAVEAAPDDALKITADHVRSVIGPDGTRDPIDGAGSSDDRQRFANETEATEAPGIGGEADVDDQAPDDDDHSDRPKSDEGIGAEATRSSGEAPSVERTRVDGAVEPNRVDNPSVSSGTNEPDSRDVSGQSPPETKGSGSAASVGSSTGRDQARQSVRIDNDMTGHSTGTGTYKDFVTVFRDRYERLSAKLQGRVNRRPASAIQSMAGGQEAAMIGMVDDVRSTASGHWLIDLEDTTGTFPCLIMKDREFADAVDEILMDEVLAVEGTLSDDAGILFVDSLHFPDVPRTYSPSTADRPVKAALISDVHVGSQEFVAEAWHRFADWLHTEEASDVEYLLIAGDMVEGVGVYPDQDEELDIIDIYEQYEAFSEYLKEVPGDMEIVMVPGNHDAVRLAEPQPGFDEELREIMTAHDARFASNPAFVTVEGVTFLLYHGVSLDELIAELPDEKASYDEPHRAMYQLLKKRHVAPQFGGHMRLAPEERDYLVMEEIPDVFHTGHVHKLGYGKYHNVTAINSGCWQAQTAFQKSVNIDPDVGFAPIVHLDTLDVTIRKFT